MIPKVKRIVENEEKVFFGKIKIIKSDFVNIEKSVDIIRESLVGENEIDLSISMCDGKVGEYSILVKDNEIDIRTTKEGVYSSLSTLLSKIKYEDNKSYINRFEVNDYPRFSHRGVMLDEARHFQGEVEVKKLLDIMFKTKMNVFHWHLSDDQGFRIYLDKYPKLSEIGSKRNYSIIGGYLNQKRENIQHSGIYTVSKIKEIIEYANIRGIKVLPEIDLPGHFSAVLASYPEYTCEGKLPEVLGRYGIIENILCLGNSEAREFAKDILLEVTKIFGNEIHIGFDEIKKDKLKKCPKCQQRIKELQLEDENALIENFRQEVRDFLISKGIKVTCWNDGLKDVDKLVTVQHWKGNTEKDSAKRLNNGQKMIVSDFYHYYTDYPYSMTPLKKTYNYNPIIEGVTKPENILGIETPIWTEWIDSHEKLAFNCYYRIALIAERGWNEEKMPYESVMKELRDNEEKLFGEVLNIPEKMLNPSMRFFKFIKYAFDSQVEVKKYLREKNR